MNNPVIKILQWELKEVSEDNRTVMVIQNVVVVKNLPNFPILGLPQPLHRMKMTVIPAKSSAGHAPTSNAAILTWRSILCFLNEVDVDKDWDKKSFIEVVCKQIIEKTEHINEPTPQGWRYLCTDCYLYKCRRLSQIVNHVQLSHLPHFPGYKCPHCSQKFQAILSFENHIKDDHFFNSKSKSHPPKHIEVSSSLPAPMIPNTKIQGISDLAAGILSSMDSHFMLHPGPVASQNSPRSPGHVANPQRSPGNVARTDMMSEVSFSNLGRQIISQPTPRINLLSGNRQQVMLGPARGI